MKGNNFDNQYKYETLPSIQDLSKKYKKLFRKQLSPTRKQSNKSKVFETFKTLTY